MTRSEDCAAILIRKYRCIKRADFARYPNDILLIHSDERTEHGTVGTGLGYAHCGGRLACDLTEAFARDEHGAFMLLGYAGCERHHKPTEDQRKIILFAIVTNLLLNVRERDYVHADLSAILAKLTCKC